MLHIGGARTALFSWAFARGRGGRFLLRIEDTDQARSTPEATRRIVEDLAWLGIDWDEGPDAAAVAAGGDPYDCTIGDQGPYFQSRRLHTYAEAVKQLLDSGRAYRCYKTPEDLTAERDAARAAGKPYKYDRGEAIALSKQRIVEYEAAGRPFVIRFRMPDQDIVVHDEVLGDVVTAAAELEDFVIQKSDGFPTFHLAVVCDDAAMGVTHVIRGQEHLNNTPRHVAVQDALGCDRPTYAHIPLIFNSDGSKMSKRDKAKAARAAAVALPDSERPEPPRGMDPRLWKGFIAGENDDLGVAVAMADMLGVTLPEIDVADFRRSGYLPPVLCNYLALLGWSPGEDIERFGDDPMAFLAARFSLDRVGKSNARFDRDKLFRFNLEGIAALSPERFRGLLREHLRLYHPGYVSLIEDEKKFAVFAESYRERSRTLEEPAENGRMFIVPDDEIEYDDKAAEKNLLRNEREGLAVLRALRPRFAGIEPWSGEAGHEALLDAAEAMGLKLGKLAQPLRVALSGGTVTPPMDRTLELLGQASTLARVDRCIERFG